MRLFIANRGEIAARVARAARELGLGVVGAFTDVDAGAFHTTAVDEAVPLGSADGYLSVERLVAAAKSAGCTAVHPGYGFLAENATFAQAVIDAGLSWVGPSPAAIAAMGDKQRARALVMAAGVPLVPSGVAAGFPALVKAAAGGGGRGMRVVHDAAALAAAEQAASSEAMAAFGDGTVYVERLVEGARHVEVQVLGDSRGKIVSLGTRDCSLQRRHQKLVEEAPAPGLAPATRDAMELAALNAARAVAYEGAGTVEFLLDPSGAFYFIEMNTRVQVEHPVTELVTGIDIVVEQLRVAMGESAADPTGARGHAIECRVIAEDPQQGFVPSPGRLVRFRPPSGPGVRVDAGVAEGSEVTTAYDSLLAKVVVHAPNRDLARARMAQALGAFEIAGVFTTAALCRELVLHDDFAALRIHTRWLEAFMETRPPAAPVVAALAAAALGHASSPGLPGRVAIPTPWTSIKDWR